MNMKKTIVDRVMVCCFALWALIAFETPSAHSAEQPKMPSTVDAMGKTLHLNGTGLRTATLLHFKVYEAGLYLQNRSSNPQQILSSPDPKVVRLAFLRDVTVDQMKGAWKEGFEKNCETNCADLKAPLNELMSKLPAAKSGDVVVYIMSLKGIHIVHNGREVAQANNPALARTILSFWLGKQPPSTDLKQALLGMNQTEELS
jgi:hypothetical protein